MRAARAVAETLLNALPAVRAQRGAARLILTAACLHLHPITGPDPTLGDLRAFLRALAAADPNAWADLARSPLGLVQYVGQDFGGGDTPRAQAALALAVQAVTLCMHAD
ncbi:MAG: hypothetical protein JO303_15310 [Caulobacteraceae bacterium]|nr:hypothetical protein [Caulobacteraceae bacterium]